MYLAATASAGKRFTGSTVRNRFGDCRTSRANPALALRFLLLAPALMGTGCTSADVEARALTATFQSATRQGLECRYSVASKPEYRIIAVYMPLADINQATLAQMIDTSYPDGRENSALAAWQKDMRACGNRLVDAVESTAPVYVPIVIAAWNRDDEVLVLLARRKITWGDAVMRLKANRVELMTKLTDQMSQTMTQLTQRKESELNRRAKYIDALVGLVP
jgi:hypothetical protein